MESRWATEGGELDFSTPEATPNLRAYLEFRNAIEFAFTRVAKRSGANAGCRVGCAHCCTHDQPSLTPQEAAALIELCIRDKALHDVLQKCEEQRAWLRVQTEPPLRGDPNLACPFLEPTSRRCRIYRQRPLGCIAAVSPDRKACEAQRDSHQEVPWDIRRVIPEMMSMSGILGKERMKELVDTLSRLGEGGNALPLGVALATLADPEAKGGL